MARTATMDESSAQTRVERLLPFRVVLHNDDFNEADFVVVTLIELIGLEEVAAIERMLEAHVEGAAVLVETHRERAELYVEQFASKGLTATCERAG